MLEDLAAAIHDVATVDVSALTTPERNAHLARLRVLHNQWNAAQLLALADFDASGAWTVDAAHSAANWLATNTGTSRADARRSIRLAATLSSMPLASAAFAAGEITQAHIAVLAKAIANPRVRDAFADQEAHFVDHARTMPADQLDNLVRRWIDYLDQDGPQPADTDRDSLHAAVVGDRVRLRGDLCLTTGLPLLAALQERADALWRQDRDALDTDPDRPGAFRPTSARNAQALADLVAAGTASASNPRRRQPLVTVHVDAKTLASGRLHPDSLHETDDGTIIPLGVLARWLDGGALVHRVLFGEAGEVLDVGRSVRYATGTQRRALTARDRGCAVPGCGRPPSHCDAHHLRHWEDGGRTDIGNLALLCRHHHRSIHAGHLRITMKQGTPQFFDRYNRRVTGRRDRPPPVPAAHDAATRT